MDPQQAGGATSNDTWTWVQIASTIVQAIATGVIAWFTVVLAGATKKYAQTTHDQLQELERGRLAQFQPYVHVTGVSFAEDPKGKPLSGEPPNLRGLELVIDVKNIGPGPALGIRAYPSHKELGLQPRLEPVDLELGDRTTLRFPGAGGASASHKISQDFRLWLEYHDIYGRKWRTMTPLRLHLVEDSVSGYSSTGVHRVEEDERVKEVGEHYIQQHGTLAALARLDQDSAI